MFNPVWAKVWKKDDLLYLKSREKNVILVWLNTGVLQWHCDTFTCVEESLSLSFNLKLEPCQESCVTIYQGMKGHVW